MKLKTKEIEGVTYAEIQDGKPVYIEDNGSETAFDAPATRATITRLNGEAKGHREAKEAAEAALKKFEGIEDPAAAIDAIRKVASLKDKDLIDAGKVEEIKQQAIKAVEEKYAPIVQERDGLVNQLHSEKIGGSFARSKYIGDKLAVPSDMVEAMFGKHFTLDNGKIVAKDANGNQIYSKANPGNPADFDEALEAIVGAYAGRDHILKGTGHNGSGKQPGTNGSGGGSKTITRAEFEALDHSARGAKIKEGFKVVDAA
ncbi:hypothetical protein MNR02_06600 [Shinella sp. H4-D48]|uniref:DUF6651 domain-containing protein n=1 Tax=Shinella sp. H4-D48 TaxID=2925841 RepID=UPI001F52F4E3|nr:DUF6651 domain-containing protein [Shinella sp. H4-D48]UNK39371.1 hypothetical protein MNR02_06600 [Shinella sp. H4-D48]